jgi:GNAT superfamily N-acetyltransferase
VSAELEFVDLRRERDPELLEALHRELFVPNFPDPDEQESPDDWIPRLWGEPDPPRPEQYAVVARADTLAGFAFVERYRTSRCALVSYIAVDASARQAGLGRELLSRALRSARDAAEADGEPLRAVFAEIHDPARVPDTGDVIRPADRVRIMARLGAERVPVTYVQPALDDTSARSDRLMLIAFPLDGELRVTGSDVTGFLDEYYRACGVADPGRDPDLLRVRQELDALGVGADDAVQLEPLDAGE